ncbi:MAG: nucleoside monophosphate kinase [Patescibacteria group bacterium]
MRSIDFPIFKTKISGVEGRFNLNDPIERKKYFEAKAGKEIEKLKKYLEKNTFLAFLMGKKNSGKGTYSKLFMEAVGKNKVGHISVGDVVRDVHRAIETGEGKKELMASLEKNYRGFHSLQEVEDIILGRDTKSLVSSELIVALLQYEISRRPRQAIFIDGFPRALDQIGYSLMLKQVLGYRDDPDFLVFISVPETVIDARIKARVICPICKTPRSLKLAPTAFIGQDEKTGEFYLMCDDPKCNKARMVTKEGDSLGIEPIRDRLELDDKIFRQLLTLKGLPQIKLRNSIPKDKAWDYVEKYEVTPMYSYKKGADGKIEIIEEPWVVPDDDGVESVSLLPAPVALGFIKQTAEVLNL